MARIQEIPDRLAPGLEEQEVVIDGARAHELGAQRELPLQDADRTRAQDDASIITGLGRVLVGAVDACLGDSQLAAGDVEVRDAKRNLL